MEPLAFAYGPRPRTCIIEGCDARHYARGWCKRHYRQHYDAGPLPQLVHETPAERFERLHEKRPDGCWHWTGPLSPAGYGVLDARGRWIAHRWAYEHFVGPIPDGFDIDHACHNPDPDCPGGDACLHRRCVNPAHLEPATRRENLSRSRHTTVGRPPATECAKGHPLEGDNLYFDSDGRRRCRTCSREWGRAHRERRAAETADAPLPICDCGRTCKALYSTRCHRCACRAAAERRRAQ